MKIYMVRHGETEWNREGRYYGISDVGLTEKGREQAKVLGHFFKNIEFDQVMVSPLKRAMDTAKELTGHELTVDKRLMEQNFGIFEGFTYGQLLEKFPEELDGWNRDYENYCIPEGESFSMFRKRVDEFVADLWNQANGYCREKEKDAKILIVAHKGTFGHMLASMLKLPQDGYWNFVFEQGTYTQVDLQDGYAILRAVNKIPV